MFNRHGEAFPGESAVLAALAVTFGGFGKLVDKGVLTAEEMEEAVNNAQDMIKELEPKWGRPARRAHDILAAWRRDYVWKTGP